MFDLDDAVREWRRGFVRERTFTTDDLDELEDHLRAAYDLEVMLDPSGPPAVAFGRAREMFGSPADLSEEFSKVEGRGWRKLVTAGWVTFAVAFFLPVARYGITLGEWNFHQGLLPGIEAIILTLTGAGGAFGVLSALTNLPMFATFWRISDASRLRIRTLAWLMTLCATINLYWLVMMDDKADLFAGYYTWWASFAIVGSGLWMRARSLPETSTEPDPALIE